MGLKQIAQSCKEITEELGKKLDSIPKNQSCVHSDFPKRMWCEELKKPALYGVCEKCPINQSKYIN